jgi:hypothetical protein
MKKGRLILIVFLAFLIGVIACHLFYYSNSYLNETKLQEEVERLKNESYETRLELDKIDSLLNEIQ